ncbi:GMP synthase - Glutamine amidotransferase [Candidatus Methanophagaceae archaeon]|nr:GMP synthase - Glutamine amidotransferase [Methanophagales archaeon]
MKAQIVQHIECEGPGYLGDFLHDNGIEYEIVRMYEGEQLPDIFDVLIVLGGPMNVYEEERYPYLKGLNKTIKNFATGGGFYLGFCLGGQLLAKALGAKVRRNHTKEIGNFEIQLTDGGVEDQLFKGFGTAFPALEWHGDTFEIPAGAIKLVGSALCANQAFRFKNAYGLQFHLEATTEMLAEWVNVYGDELTEEEIDAAALIEELKIKVDIYRELSNQLFTNFFRCVKNYRSQ